LPGSFNVQPGLADIVRDGLATASARESIIAWWENAWLPDPALRARFERETAAALPVTTGASTGTTGSPGSSGGACAFGRTSRC
jgi:hypothetical protein